VGDHKPRLADLDDAGRDPILGSTAAELYCP
jgi:hypothetical protein